MPSTGIPAADAPAPSHATAESPRDLTRLGELFWEHGQCLYRPLLHMPLLIRDPRQPRGERIAAPVSLRDLGATILDLASVEPAMPFPGHSLARSWDPAAVAGAVDSPLFSHLGQGINTPLADPNTAGDMQSLFADGLHYIRNGDGTEELYASRRIRRRRAT